MFESELKNYDELFKDDNYILNYIVCRDYFGGEDEIRILFKTLPKPTEGILTGKGYNLKTLLQNYCKYFSIKEVTVLKSLRVEQEGKRYTSSSLVIPKIEDRVYFEYFRMIDKYVEVTE